MAYVFFPSTVLSAVQNSLILNEANTVSGTKYLDPANTPTRMDTALGRVQGNGQNWLEFLVVQGDDLGGGAFKNTLDLRGWKLDWQYNKDNLGVSMGHGELKFTDDPVWAAVPRGTILTISEWQDVWYSKTPDSADKDPNDSTPRNGLPRVGGINGFGTNPGAAYSASADYKLGANLARRRPIRTFYTPTPVGIPRRVAEEQTEIGTCMSTPAKRIRIAALSISLSAAA